MDAVPVTWPDAVKRSPLAPSSKPMKRGGFQARSPMATTDKPAKLPSGQRKRLKTKQRAVSDTDKAYWDRLAQLGCIACLMDGHRNPVVSIHHIDGRTKPGCHSLVLPLCAGHHQQGTGNDPTLVAVHPYKARFVKLYGTELELKARCDCMLQGGV